VVQARRDEPEWFAVAPARRPGRAGLLLGLPVAVVLIASAIAVPRILRDDGPVASVRTGPIGAAPSVGRATPAPPTVEMQVADGWQTLLADGDRLVVGTRPLAERDLLLALLARDDVAFSAFPPDAAVLVVGGDRLKAKYLSDPSKGTRTTTASGAEMVELGPDALIAPGPAFGLGPVRQMAGGVAARLGDVPQSTSTIAAYFGPTAPVSYILQAEAMAATVHLLPTDPAASPPPLGSRPGFDAGTVPAGARLHPVASFSTSGTTYTARGDGDCADVVLSGSLQPQAGGCSRGRPEGSDVDVVAVMFTPGLPQLPPPGQAFAPGKAPPAPVMIVLARVGPEAHAVGAVLIDGRTVPAAVGTDGWALVVTGPRPFLLEVRNARGEVVTQTPVR
jgi:hypothetical protein